MEFAVKKEYIIISILVLIIIILIIINLTKFCFCSINNTETFKNRVTDDVNHNNDINVLDNINTSNEALKEPYVPHVIYKPSLINHDIIRQYDYRKTFDPFEDPKRRVARHEIHPLHLKRLIDLPTRGYPDNYTQVGLLVKHIDTGKKDDNKILRLFGRQEYPGSYRYEYYATINSGYDKIKIPIDVSPKKELYDDDVIYVKELKADYRVQLHKYDEPKYYPDILY